MVSKASEDLPEPDSPVNTISASRGISRSTFLRLCSRAPRTWMVLWVSPAPTPLPAAVDADLAILLIGLGLTQTEGSSKHRLGRGWRACGRHTNAQDFSCLWRQEASAVKGSRPWLTHFPRPSAARPAWPCRSGP